MVFGTRGSGVCRDTGDTHALHLPRFRGAPSSPPPAMVTSRAATLPRAGTWGQVEPRRATSMSPAYLVTLFLTDQLVLAVLPAEQGCFCQQDTQGLAPSMTQLLEMFLQGLVTPQPGFLTCWVWVTTPQCPTSLPSQDLTRPITDEAVALPAKLGSKGPSPVPAG